MKISQKISKMEILREMSSEKPKMFIPLLIFLVTTKNPLNFLFIEKLSTFLFEKYIVLNKKYKM